MDDEKYEGLESSIRKIAEASEPLFRQAELEYTPLVDSLIRRQCKDSKEIEQLLDGLLNFASDERMLNLFRKLCQYYYSIDPMITAEYINIYRKMWDSEDELFQSGYFKNTEII